MKNISILKTIMIIQAIACISMLVKLFFGKRFSENTETIVSSVSVGLIGVALILAFSFGKKLEQEKIEREEGKQEAKRKIN